MRVQRHKTGSVRYDKRRKTWNYLWYDGPTRRSKRIGTSKISRKAPRGKRRSGYRSNQNRRK